MQMLSFFMEPTSSVLKLVKLSSKDVSKENSVFILST